MEPFYERQPLRFDCTRCGRCCTTAGGFYVFLGVAEAEGIRAYLDLSPSWFRRRYLRRLQDGELVASWHSDGRCVFLDSSGACIVYPVRPLQCRAYPFWPEIACRHSDWRRESRRCEGIDRGAEVPVTRIRRLVKSCRERQR
jgi:Fe-S-cluster containining protein